MTETLTLIGIAVASAALGITFAELSGIPNGVKKWLMWKGVWYRPSPYEKLGGHATSGRTPKRIKPFDCHLCLSFWACFLICHFHQSHDLLTSALTACCSAVFSVWAWKQIRP